MEISKFNQPSPVTTATTNTAKTAVNPESTPASVTQTNQAKISHDFAVLSQAQQALNDIPEVDLERVAQVQQSIKDGSFSIDLEQIAEVMSQQHSKN